MDLKSALSTLARFTAAKATATGQHTVRLSPGQVAASNLHSGCRIPVESVDVEASVSFRDFRKIVAAVDDVTMVVKRNTLYIEGGGSTFKLKCFPAANLAVYPEEPEEKAWSPASGSALVSLAALTSVIDANGDVANGLTSLRITPGWAATATQATLVVLHEGLGVDESVSVAPEAVAGLSTSEGGSVCVLDNKLWVRDEATKQVRWAQALATPWPDSIVDSMLPTTVGTAGRVEAQADLAALKGLADRAKLLMSGDEYGCLNAHEQGGCLTISGNFARGDFNGTVALEIDESSSPVGISPTRLSAILDVVGSAAEAYGSGGGIDLSFGGETAAPQPIVMKAGPIEALLMPVVLP
tara:strand:+ start:163 stop:1227 length:1065 start_codon:yes stop_codon:yes gene_type:complete